MMQELVAIFGRKYSNFRKLINPVSKLSRGFGGGDSVISLVNGFEYRLNLDEYIQYQMYFFGLFDKKGVDLIVSICDKINCRTALDIGGNVGNHAVHLSDVCQRVYSFEPNNTPGDVFESALKSKKSNIELLHYGLGEKNERLDFFEDEVNLGRSSFVKEHIQRKAFSGKKVLEVKVGDQVVSELGLENIDFIKIDVEGFEIQVLAGLKNTIVENQPIIDFEFNSITRNGFGDLAGLNKLLPDYSFHGTRRVGLGLIKEKLKIIDFDFSKDYAHVIAVPKRFSEMLIQSCHLHNIVI